MELESLALGICVHGGGGVVVGLTRQTMSVCTDGVDFCCAVMSCVLVNTRWEECW